MKLKNIRQFASGLVQVSLNSEALIDFEKVSAVIIILKELYSGTDLRNVLGAFLLQIERFVQQTMLKIEHCGKLSDASIAKIQLHFEKLLGRKLKVVTAKSNRLIAGIKISISDFAVENSVLNTLNSYKTSLKH